MNHIVILLILQSLQNLNSESSDQPKRDSLEVVVLNKLVKINAKQLKAYDQMLSEYAVVLHSDYVVYIVWVMLLKVWQDL